MQSTQEKMKSQIEIDGQHLLYLTRELTEANAKIHYVKKFFLKKPPILYLID